MFIVRRSVLSGSGFRRGADPAVDLEDEPVVLERAFAFASQGYGFESFPVGESPGCKAMSVEMPPILTVTPGANVRLELLLENGLQEIPIAIEIAHKRQKASSLKSFACFGVLVCYDRVERVFVRVEQEQRRVESCLNPSLVCQRRDRI